MSKEIIQPEPKQQPKRVFSGDQAAFSQWDSLIKLHGYRVNGGEGAITHQFHLADTFGKGNEGIDEIHRTHEVYRYKDGKELQPSWFAVTESWPPFPRMATIPHRVGEVVGEKFETFAKNTAKSIQSLPDEERETIERVAKELGQERGLPQSEQDVYESLTSGNILGIADAGTRSASSYSFTEIEDIQKGLMRHLYADVSKMIHPQDRDGLKDRYRAIVDAEGPYYQLARGKDLPSLAKDVFTHASQQIEQLVDAEIGEMQVGETTEYFRLTREDGTIEDTHPDAFTFLDWYLKNQDVYTSAHNEVSDEMSHENPIQSLSTTKGETPFWVIMDGVKNKLHLKDNVAKIVRREGDKTVEETVAEGIEVADHQELGALFSARYPGREVTVIPTAIGLALNLRANGDLLLPEHGSHYVGQLNKVYERMLLTANREQYASMLPQGDIVRVHPHALSSLPEDKKLKMPSHLADAFPVDDEGYTTTDAIKAMWKDVAQQRRAQVEKVIQAKGLTEKAKLLFGDVQFGTVHELISHIESTENSNSALKVVSTGISAEIKRDLEASGADVRIMGAVSAYMRGKAEALPEGIDAVTKRADQLKELREYFTSLEPQLQRKGINESVLKYLIALRARQLEAGAETLEYFDARPALLSTYLLLGEEGVRNMIHSTESYREETPHPIEKEWYDAEGNRLLVIHDKNGENSIKRKRIVQKITQNLQDDGFDTAMVLTPSNQEGIDFMVDQVCLDGSTGGMCGNGVRSVARFAYDRYGMEQVVLATEQGEIVEGFKDGELFGARLRATSLTPDTTAQFQGIIPETALNDESLPVTIVDRLQTSLYEGFEAAEDVRVLSVTSVSGEPHLVVGLKSPHYLSNGYLPEIAQLLNATVAIEGEPLFPNEANVSFVSESDEGFMIATHERGGPGVTGACGTGAVSVMSVLQEHGYNDLTFSTPKGQLRVETSGEHYIIKGNVEPVI